MLILNFRDFFHIFKEFFISFGQLQIYVLHRFLTKKNLLKPYKFFFLRVIVRVSQTSQSSMNLGNCFPRQMACTFVPPPHRFTPETIPFSLNFGFCLPSRHCFSSEQRTGQTVNRAPFPRQNLADFSPDFVRFSFIRFHDLYLLVNFRVSFPSESPGGSRRENGIWPKYGFRTKFSHFSSRIQEKWCKFNNFQSISSIIYLFSVQTMSFLTFWRFSPKKPYFHEK